MAVKENLHLFATLF